jgi:hypothetical protein
MPSPYAFTLDTGEVLFDPHPHQAQIMTRLAGRFQPGEGPSKFFLRGNRGGGKSVMMRHFLHGLAMACPGFRYVVVRRNNPDLLANHLIYLTDEMRKLRGDYVQTPLPMCRYHNGSIGFYRQCEEFRDVEKIVGAEAGALFVDEAPQIEWDFISLMMPSLRVAQKDGKQPYYTITVLSGNPTGTSIEDLDRHFIEKDITDNQYYAPEDYEHIPIHLKDNPSLDPDEYLKSLGAIPLAFRAAWIDGVRMDARTLFDIKKTRDGKPWHYIQELPKVAGVPLLRVPWIQLYRSFDMGYFPDPAVSLWLAVVGRRIIAVHEETWFRTIAKDLAAKIVQQTRELVGENTVAMTYVDPDIAIKTGSDTVTVMDTLEINGVPCEPSINDRVLYADAIHSLLGEEIQEEVNGEIVTYPRFQVYEPGCPMLARYLPKMRWDEKNPRKMADHKFDHWPVALAYFAISSGVLARSEQASEARRPVWMDWMEESGNSRRRVS